MTRHLNQLKDESNRDYELFCEYFNQGFDRNIANFAALNKIPKRTIYRIAKKNQWKERIAKNMQEYIQENQAKFAHEHKALIDDQITSMKLGIRKVKELQMAVDVQLEDYARLDGPIDEFYDKVNKYMTIKLKIQRYENNFYKQLKEFDSNEDHELENLEAEIEEYDEENEDIEDQEFESGTNNFENSAPNSANSCQNPYDDDLNPEFNEELEDIENDEIDNDTNNFENFVPNSATLCQNPFLEQRKKVKLPTRELSSNPEIAIVQKRLGVLDN